MSSIFGIFGGTHNAAVACIVDGEIKSVIEEERLVRIKSGNDYMRLPDLALGKVQEQSGIKIDDADYVMFCKNRPINFANNINNFAEDVSHHLCHATGTYYTSNMTGKTLVVSTDGGGSFSYGRYYLAEDGKMTQIHNSLMTNASAGQFYGWVTQMLGWQMLKDEGKVTGLAAHGHYDERIYKLFKQCLYYKDLDFQPSDHVSFTQFVCQNLEDEDNWCSDPEKKKVMAYNAQLVFEEAMMELFNHLHDLYPEYRNVAVAGGPFANVKLNQKLNELEWVNELYIYPPMGDDGLALGAAIKKSVDLNEWKFPQRLKNVFFGVSYTNEEVLEEAKNFPNLEYLTYESEKTAGLLNAGNIIGFFKGRFEHGPRALGARSILVRPTDEDTHEKLNTRLGRHEIMPFAPVVLQEYAKYIFHNSEKSKYTAEFMTLCYITKDDWINKIPAVVHKEDGTARPQYVTKENNPDFYEIVDEYRKASGGIPLLLNTSFNGHGQPIINDPKYAFEHLDKGTLDYLVIEDYLFWRKK